MWKAKVMEIKQPGIHFLIDKNLDMGLTNFLSLGGYPGYALMDKQGFYRRGAIGQMENIKNCDAFVGLIGKWLSK
jgi:hypothetical protein